ncbi:MAG: glycosyltransferase [Acetobacteraceae bacterium]|nr:glycosyltransferase [Acetobacteraceae bacterium]
MTLTPQPTPDSRRPLLVYRDRIGVPSEIAFSRRQYLNFQTLRPVWIGRSLMPEAGQVGGDLVRIGGARGMLFRHLGLIPPLDLTGFARVVHAQFARGGALALPLAQGMDARMVVTLHGGDVGKDKNWRHTLLARRWPAVIARTYRFVCVSHAVADTAMRRGAPGTLLTVLPIGVEVPPALPVGARDGGFLFAGRFVEKKGISVIADAMRHLRANGGAVKLVCAGDGPLRPVLEALAREIPGVELVGWLSQPALAARMEAALALLVPSVIAVDGDAEGLPSVVPEAMARGCAVIGTAEGGIAEAIEDDVTGLLVAPSSASALAGAMHRLSTDPALASRLALAAFHAVGERLNASRQSAALETILLAAEGTSPNA